MTVEKMIEAGALAAKVEGLTGPCRETDVLIGVAIDLMVDDRTLSFRRSFEICGMEMILRMAQSHQNIWRTALPRYTSSLDAIREAFPYLCPYASDIGADGLAIVRLVADTSTTPVVEYTGIASRLEHAWLAAALRARHAEMNKGTIEKTIEAELARIIDPEAFECLRQGNKIPSDNDFNRMKIAKEKAHACLTAALASEAAGEPEPVAWQRRYIGERLDKELGWQLVSEAFFNMLLDDLQNGHGGYELRKLYATPPKPAAVPTVGQLLEAIRDSRMRWAMRPNDERSIQEAQDATAVKNILALLTNPQVKAVSASQFLSALLIIFAGFVLLVWLLHPSKPTADQRYGCTVAQQAPNGECR